MVDKKDTLTVVSVSKDYTGTLYSLEDNSVVYENLVPFQTTLDSWTTVDNEDELKWNQVDNLIYPDDTPATPRTPPCQKNLMEAFEGNEAFSLWTGGKGKGKTAVMKMMNEHVEAQGNPAFSLWTGGKGKGKSAVMKMMNEYTGDQQSSEESEMGTDIWF